MIKYIDFKKSMLCVCREDHEIYCGYSREIGCGYSAIPFFTRPEKFKPETDSLPKQISEWMVQVKEKCETHFKNPKKKNFTSIITLFRSIYSMFILNAHNLTIVRFPQSKRLRQMKWM